MFQLQVGKAYFELVDYLEADRAFNLARRAAPYSLEGMDIYSTVLYVSFILWFYLKTCILSFIWLASGLHTWLGFSCKLC